MQKHSHPYCQLCCVSLHGLALTTERDQIHRSSQTDLTVPADYTTTSPAELHFIPKSVREKVRELNLKARLFDDQYFARIFRPRSLQNSPWGSPKALSPVADTSCNNHLSRSAENIHTVPRSPLRRKNSSNRSSRANLHWHCNDLSANHTEERALYRAMVNDTEELQETVLHGLYNKARVMTLYEAKCLMTLLLSKNEDVLVKTLTTMSNCAAFTINQVSGTVFLHCVSFCSLFLEDHVFFLPLLLVNLTHATLYWNFGITRVISGQFLN